jgi:tetratricopeptide (TPR) repeat protein
MVGLPNIHTIGACAGKMVALTSPSATKQKFNWARVLKHEFVHVINLQQTNFNIPHWYTEALAVLLEDSPRSAAWNEMLARRVPAGKTFDLDSINLGFIRPASSEDWQMAYCQAEIYAEYMIARFGEAALGKMLAGYRDNLNTAASIERAFGVKVADFEQGYIEHLAEIVKSLAPPQSATVPRDFVELQKAQAEHPGDLQLAAELALANLRRKQLPAAGHLADRVLAKEPHNPVASYVKARLLLTIGQGRRALELLEGGLNKQSPNADVLRLLAGLRFKAEDYAAAEGLYQLAEKHDADNLEWTKTLAMVYLKTGEQDKLIERLTRLAEADGDELLLRKKLVELAFEQKDFAAAARWANQCLQIDVLDATLHAALARASFEQQHPTDAAREYAVAVQLEPNNVDWRLELAKSQAAAGDRPTAQATLTELLKLQPQHPTAQDLLDDLKRE